MATVTGKSFSERVSRWQVLVNNLKETAALPHVIEELAKLEALLAQVRALQDRSEDYRAQVREINTELTKLAQDGDKLRRRLGANLQAKFGFTSESLIRYGFKPQRVTRRRSKAEAAKAAKAVTVVTPAAPAATPAVTDGAATTEG